MRRENITHNSNFFGGPCSSSYPSFTASFLEFQFEGTDEKFDFFSVSLENFILTGVYL